MAKKLMFEVVGTKPVCVDFPGGHTVSLRPGSRFEAYITNNSVRRLLRVKEIRQVQDDEVTTVTPVKLGYLKTS